MHAQKQMPIQYTFDVTIPLNRIIKETDDDEKRVYLEFEFFDKKGFVKTETIKEDNNKFIIIKFDSYKNLRRACQLYNRTHSECKVELKKYYRIGTERYFSKDFKILNIPEHISTEQVQQDILKLIKRSSIQFRSRNSTNDIYFFINETNAINILKETWSLIIQNEFYRIVPAYYKRGDIERRNRWVAKYKGFKKDDSCYDIKEIFEQLGGVNFIEKILINIPIMIIYM